METNDNTKHPWPLWSTIVFSLIFGSLDGFIITWQNLKRLGKENSAKEFFLKGGFFLFLASLFNPIILYFSKTYPLKESLGSFITVFYPFWLQLPYFFDTIFCLIASLIFPLWFFQTQLKKETGIKTKFSWSILLWSIISLLAVFVLITGVKMLNLDSSDSVPIDCCSSTETPFILNKDNLIGVWQASSAMGSGWSNRFEFYPDGKYNYLISTMTCDSREQGFSGTWDLKDNQLTLIEKEKSILEGGWLERATGSCGTEKALVGGKIVKIIYPNPIIHKLNIKLCPKGSIESCSPHPAISIDNVSYWKFSDNPDSSDY